MIRNIYTWPTFLLGNDQVCPILHEQTLCHLEKTHFYFTVLKFPMHRHTDRDTHTHSNANTHAHTHIHKQIYSSYWHSSLTQFLIKYSNSMSTSRLGGIELSLLITITRLHNNVHPSKPTTPFSWMITRNSRLKQRHAPNTVSVSPVHDGNVKGGYRVTSLLLPNQFLWYLTVWNV